MKKKANLKERQDERMMIGIISTVLATVLFGVLIALAVSFDLDRENFDRVFSEEYHEDMDVSKAFGDTLVSLVVMIVFFADIVFAYLSVKYLWLGAWTWGERNPMWGEAPDDEPSVKEAVVKENVTKPAPKKRTAKKTTVKTAPKKTVAKKTAAKKTVAKTAPKKTVAKKTTAKKTVAKKKKIVA